jgi:hypothetical protein
MTKDKALDLALEALDGLYEPGEMERVNRAITAIKQALAAPVVQEPVAWRWVPSKVWQDYVLSDDPQKAALAQEHGIEVEALCKCATPPAAQRQWVGLTAGERDSLFTEHYQWDDYGKGIEAKLKEKNT